MDKINKTSTAFNIYIKNNAHIFTVNLLYTTMYKWQFHKTEANSEKKNDEHIWYVLVQDTEKKSRSTVCYHFQFNWLMLNW